MANPNNLNQLLKPRYTTAAILWAALTMSMFIYLVVAYVMTQSEGEPAMTDHAFLMVIAVVAGMTMVVSVGMRMSFFSDARIEKQLKKEFTLTDLATPRTGMAPDKQVLETLSEMSDREQRLYRLPSAFFTPYIVNLAINESIVIYGLVLAFLYHDFTLMLPFVGVGLLLNLTMMKVIPSVVERAERMVR